MSEEGEVASLSYTTATKSSSITSYTPPEVAVSRSEWRISPFRHSKQYCQSVTIFARALGRPSSRTTAECSHLEMQFELSSRMSIMTRLLSLRNIVQHNMTMYL